MEVYEKINYLLEEKRMSKKIFIEALIALQPKLKSTGEVPSFSTINGYLYGRREIKIELIPYIAEVLGVQEQELFETSLEFDHDYNLTRTKEVREIVYLLSYVPTSIIEQIRYQLQKYKKLYKESCETLKKI
ncbi:MAG: XRE family transcriptional regulator [Campylobacterales bacterium]|nr:XRE family transcriptional regulator [Campylobacterales bacterium]